MQLKEKPVPAIGPIAQTIIWALEDLLRQQQDEIRELRHENRLLWAVVGGQPGQRITH